MGGHGSGRRNCFSDEERKKRGTFKESQSEAARAERAAAQVFQGPWLESIPPPDFPLNDQGRKKYDELTRILFDAGKLTVHLRMQAEIAARIWQKIATLVGNGQEPTAADYTQLQRALDALRIADNAKKPIATPGEKEKIFERFGFANRRSTKVRILRSSEDRS